MKASLRTITTALIFFALLVYTPLHAADYKPIEKAQGYNHDKFQTQPRDIIREFRAYIASFDGPDDDDGQGMSDKRGCPEWVAYEMHAYPGTLPSGHKRPNTWITDESLHTLEVAPDDSTYKNSGYSRGHMCMKQHAWRLGENADWNTHTVINACPQRQEMNGGVWLHLENLCAEWADAYGTIWIVTGPIFYDNVPDQWIGDPGEVKAMIPDAFFKIIIRQSAANTPEVLAFIIPQHGVGEFTSSSKSPLTPYLCSVDMIEALTNLDFLTALSDDVETQVERVTQIELWPTNPVATTAAQPRQILSTSSPTCEAITCSGEQVQRHAG